MGSNHQMKNLSKTRRSIIKSPMSYVAVWCIWEQLLSMFIMDCIGHSMEADIEIGQKSITRMLGNLLVAA